MNLNLLRYNRILFSVILSGGAINTPQLLELSGIGNHEILKKINDIELTHHLPGVGESLQGFGQKCHLNNHNNLKKYINLKYVYY